jgi:Fe-S-cluster containining protein
MRDGPVRRGVKRAALWTFLANRACDRALRRWRGVRPYRLAGRCHRSGQCCERPALRANLPVWYLRSLRLLFLAWQRHVNGFELVETERRGRLFVFRCTHFDRATRLCDSHGSRPGMCRDYPRELLYGVAPELFPGCGYRVVDPRAEALRAALAPLELTPEQRAKLEEGLRLGDATVPSRADAAPGRRSAPGAHASSRRP